MNASSFGQPASISNQNNPRSDLIKMYNLGFSNQTQSKNSITKDNSRLKEEANNSTTADAKKTGQGFHSAQTAESKKNFSPKVNGFATYFLNQGEDKNKSIDKDNDHSYSR